MKDRDLKYATPLEKTVVSQPARTWNSAGEAMRVLQADNASLRAALAGLVEAVEPFATVARKSCDMDMTKTMLAADWGSLLIALAAARECLKGDE